MNTLIQNKILRKLRKGNPLTSKMIEELLKDYTKTQRHTLDLWNRYLGDVPIKKRKVPQYAQSNEKLANDFAGLIINNKVGYFSGIPINYQVDKTKYTEIHNEEEILDETLFTLHNATISNFVLRNNMHDLDSEMTKIVSACGFGVRKYYTDKEANTRIVNLKPFEVIVLLNEHKEVEYAFRFYKEYNDEDKLVTHVEYYDDSSIAYFVEKGDKSQQSSKDKFVLNTEFQRNPHLHVFDYCPFSYFQNNEESMSDTEKVTSLIDAYDKVLSNNNNDLNGWSSAYMLFKNVKIDKENVEKLKELGAIEVDKDGEVSFLTKSLDATFGDSFLTRTEDNIFQFAQAVNTNDPKFNSTSGIALKYKLQPRNDKCIALESKFKRSLSEQFKIVTSAWKKLGISIDYLNIFYTFKRNAIPDLDYEANVAQKLTGIVSHRTILGLFSFVDDIEYELLELEKEGNSMRVQLTNPEANVADQYNLDSLADSNE